MAWFSQYADFNSVKRQGEKALNLQVGLSAPIWLAFGAATSAGVAWWCLSRWAEAANLEAFLAPKPASPVAEPAIHEPAIHEPDVLESAVLESAVAQATAPDDLTRLVGIGPRIAEALAAQGVTRFAHLAVWGEEDLATFDAAQSLKGRGRRSDWIGQAQRLVAEG